MFMVRVMITVRVILWVSLTIKVRVGGRFRAIVVRCRF